MAAEEKKGNGSCGSCGTERAAAGWPSLGGGWTYLEAADDQGKCTSQEAQSKRN
jgi:hypothetical protein